MVSLPAAHALEFPDDPRKWEGWSSYRSENPYERLCLDPATNPTSDQIQEQCNALLLWWQKKLPLKNQPSNPLTQLLGRGIDEASRFLVQARMQLLDPDRRREVDATLAAQAQQDVLAEFAKYVSFSIVAGVLTAEAETNLTEFGQRNGLSDEQVRTCVDEELKRNNARRSILPSATADPANGAAAPELEKEFLRFLRLGEVNMGSATDSVRDLLATVAENLGINFDRAEWLLDDYLDEDELVRGKMETRGRSHAAPASTPAAVSSAKAAGPAAVAARPMAPAPTGPLPPKFLNPVAAEMVLIPAGEFVMGSNAIDAAPNEQPLTPVRLSPFYMSRHPVTNAQYEQFDPAHRRKRTVRSGDHHPVVHVSSLEAVKFCHWLSQKEGRKYRLPTEAEWEYAARGSDGRRYPWGNQVTRTNLANFADASTAFPWRETEVNDGFAESSPVGSFPNGASSFGIEDLAGNVWEWCLDFYDALSGSPRQNPRGPGNGARRVYRGGSWKSRFSNLRATARASNVPTYSCNDVGFRIVCEC